MTPGFMIGLAAFVAGKIFLTRWLARKPRTVWVMILAQSAFYTAAIGAFTWSVHLPPIQAVPLTIGGGIFLGVVSAGGDWLTQRIIQRRAAEKAAAENIP